MKRRGKGYLPYIGRVHEPGENHRRKGLNDVDVVHGSGLLHVEIEKWRDELLT